MNWLAFIHPWMLAGLAAAGLPALIHFLTRARPRRIAFPPYQFLLESCAGEQSLHRLRTWLILAIRTLAIIVLALLFARPFLRPNGAAAAATGQRIVIIIDASLSMRAVAEGATLFARAQAEAADVLRGLDSGAQAGVILEGLKPRALLPALSRNIPALHEALVQALPTYEFGDPAAALALAAKMLGGGGTIYIFSDFQNSNWQPITELPAGIACNLRPMNGQAADNVAITDVQLSPSEPVPGETLELAARVFNCSARPREEKVRLEMGEVTGEQNVSVPAYGTAEATFNAAITRAGAFPGKVSIPSDDLAEDNTRYFVAKALPALRVLLISDDEESDARGAAFYINFALAPSPEAAPGLSVIRRQSQEADRGALETADVYVLVSPAALSGEAVEIISRRVREGARLIAIVDGPLGPALMAPAFDPPFHLQRTAATKAGEGVTLGAGRLFPDLEAGSLSALKFTRHYQCQLVENRKGEVLLWHADGSPAVTLGRAGAGAAAFVNLPLTPDGGGFIGHPLFPVMLHELLRQLRKSSGGPLTTPGAAWEAEVPARGEGEFTVTDPEGKTLPAQVLASGGTTRLALPTPRAPGIYEVRQGGVLVDELAVNVDARESDTRPIPLEKLKSASVAGLTISRDEGDLLAAVKARELWPAMAGMAAGLLALETLLLALWRRPGRRSAQSDRPPAQASSKRTPAVEVAR